MKLNQIINSYPALKNLLEIKLPANIAYKISKLIQRINPKLEIYETQRNKLIKELGEQTDKEKDIWTVKPENLEKFNKEMTKLTEIEVSLEFAPGKPLEKINILSLGEEAKLTSNDLIVLDWLFE